MVDFMNKTRFFTNLVNNATFRYFSELQNNEVAVSRWFGNWHRRTRGFLLQAHIS